MKVKTTHPVDVAINGKIKTLKPGEHEVPDHVGLKLAKNGAARIVQPIVAAAKTKATSNEA